MKYCIHCGQELPDEAKFCFNCGKSLDPKAPNNKKQETFYIEVTRSYNCIKSFRVKIKEPLRSQIIEAIDAKLEIRLKEKYYKSCHKYLINCLTYAGFEINHKCSMQFYEALRDVIHENGFEMKVESQSSNSSYSYANYIVSR